MNLQVKGKVITMEYDSTKPSTLVILWTSGDREVALKMAFMYTLNSKLKEWWKEVILIAWGPSSKLISVDTELQAYLLKIKDAGVKLLACKTCAELYGVSNDLEKLGFEVKSMGPPLSEFLKNDDFKVITL